MGQPEKDGKAPKSAQMDVQNFGGNWTTQKTWSDNITEKVQCLKAKRKLQGAKKTRAHAGIQE